jgi:hypothetical protein
MGLHGLLQGQLYLKNYVLIILYHLISLDTM